MKENKLYFAKLSGVGGMGYNTVYASSKKEAMDKLEQKIGKSVKDVIWIVSGKKAQKLEKQHDKYWAGMFD